MRKEQKTENRPMQRANLQGYHQGGFGGETYAFMGFGENLYYTSDRTAKVTMINGVLCRQDGKPLKGYGLEIETGFCFHGAQAQAILSNIFSTAIFGLFPKHLFKQQMDSTITGTECITQIMTKEFIRNNYKNFKTMWNELFPMFGITTDDGKCGMHVNISVGCLGSSAKVQEDATRKLYYIINKHYDFFRRAFYRNGSTDWCGQMPYENAKNMNVHDMPSSHANCFNGSHYDAGRIEIRLVGGQKNFACFRNTMETIFHLVSVVKGLSWKQCDDLVAIFSGCNQYVYDRLSTKCYEHGTITREQLDKIATTVVREEYI